MEQFSTETLIMSSFHQRGRLIQHLYLKGKKSGLKSCELILYGCDVFPLETGSRYDGMLKCSTNLHNIQ